MFDYATVDDKSLLVSNKIRRERVVVLFILFVVVILVIICKLYVVQLVYPDKYLTIAGRKSFSTYTLASERGKIVDRNEKILAVSVPAASVYIRTKTIKQADKNKVAELVADALKINPEDVLEKINSSEPFVWVKRQIPRELARRVDQLKLPGVGYFLESKRYYPYNNSGSALIGKVGVDGNGLSGVERTFEESLNKAIRNIQVSKDAHGKIINKSYEETELPKGDTIELSIDSEYQQIIDQELEAGRMKAKAKAAMAVLADAETGEILAMSQSPSHNFNEVSKDPKNELRNLLVEAVFEPGSIMKPIVTAQAIELGLTKASEIIFCENGKFKFGKHTINDVHPQGKLSVRDIVVRSSNIGMTKLGMRFGMDRLYKSLTDFGFGMPTNLNLDGESNGILRKIKNWSAIDVATHSYGQGVSVTPLQMVRAISAIFNGGYMIDLSLKKLNATQVKRHKILSPNTADEVTEMMYAVVEDEHGTGSKAKIPEVRVGGKTGTAQKASPKGGYMAKAYISSFIGFADATNLGVKKKLVLLVSIDEPNCGVIYGGALAAPVFQRAMSRILNSEITRFELSK